MIGRPCTGAVAAAGSETRITPHEADTMMAQPLATGGMGGGGQRLDLPVQSPLEHGRGLRESDIETEILRGTSN